MIWMHMRSNRSACCLEASSSSRMLILNLHTMLSLMSCAGSMSVLSLSFQIWREANHFPTSSNPAIRQHVQTSRSLFPHKRIIRKSEMTAQGLVVTEVQEEVTGLPSMSDSGHSTPADPTSAKSDDSIASSRKSPIAELLYMRWLEGLKIKWPSFV